MAPLGPLKAVLHSLPHEHARSQSFLPVDSHVIPPAPVLAPLLVPVFPSPLEQATTRSATRANDIEADTWVLEGAREVMRIPMGDAMPVREISLQIYVQIYARGRHVRRGLRG
jgi:hypothetical protein